MMMAVAVAMLGVEIVLSPHSTPPNDDARVNVLRV